MSDSIETEKGNIVRVDEVYSVKPLYLDKRYPARCLGIYERTISGSEVFVVEFKFTEDAKDSIVGIHRRVKSYDLDFVVFDE